MKKVFRKQILAAVLLVAMALTFTLPATAAVSDVKPGHWAYDAVQFGAAQGMIDVDAQSYSLHSPAPRKAVAFALYKLANGKDSVPVRPDGVTVPQDMSGQDAKYLDTAMWGRKHNIVQGVREEAGAWWFAPEETVTRQQMVTFLYRFAQFEGRQTPSDPAVLAKFTDGGHTSAWAREAMAWAIGQDLIHGMGDNTLMPFDTLTRGQLAQFLYNYSQKFADVEPEPSPVVTPNPTITPKPTSTPRPTVTPKPTPTPQKPSGQNRTVYVTPTGKRYHYSGTCNGGTYIQSTLEEATRRGLTPCNKCVN